MIRDAICITLYVLTIISATVTWCLAAAFLALTLDAFSTYWRGDVALLVFGILAMLILPCLIFLGSGHRRRSMTGPTIAEALTLFVFWCLFLSATAKFSASYHGVGRWNRFCRLGSHCPTGRALLSFGWITFGLLSVLLPVAIIHGILAEKHRDNVNTVGGGGEGGPTQQVQGGGPTTTTPMTGKEGVGGTTPATSTMPGHQPVTTQQIPATQQV